MDLDTVIAAILKKNIVNYDKGINKLRHHKFSINYYNQNTD